MKLTPSILNEIKNNQNTRTITRYKPDGTIVQFPEAIRGNSIYAWREENKKQENRKCLLEGGIDKTILFVTLTIPHNGYRSACELSWRYINKTSGPFLTKLRKMGMEKYLITFEATYEGGCHSHLISQWNKPFQTREMEGKLFLADRKLEKEISDKWLNEWKKKYPNKRIKDIEIQVCPTLIEAEKTFGYVTKWIGKGSNINVPLYNVEKGIANKNDVAKLFTNYWAMKLGIRLYRTSKNLCNSITL
jgi:hypothetical protein